MVDGVDAIVDWQIIGKPFTAQFDLTHNIWQPRDTAKMRTIDKMALRTRFKEQLVEGVKPFTLLGAPIGWPGESEQLFYAVRKYYLLLPAVGLKDAWPDQNKAYRRTSIKNHLEHICEQDSITKNNVDTVDRWLTNMQTPRTQLLQYGRRLEELYGKICFICGQEIKENKTVDHILPLSRGGEDGIENYRLAHKACNSAKNNLLIGDHFAWSPSSLDVHVENIPIRLKYFVFLRDDFTCTNTGCGNGINNGHELTVKLLHTSGIACYDNIVTECKLCNTERIGE